MCIDWLLGEGPYTDIIHYTCGTMGGMGAIHEVLQYLYTEFIKMAEEVWGELSATWSRGILGY